MKVKNSILDFTYQRKKYQGQVSMFKPARKMMVRVYVPLGKNKEEVFIFYKIKKDELFWFDYHDKWLQNMAKTIANAVLNQS